MTKEHDQKVRSINESYEQKISKKEADHARVLEQLEQER